MSKEKKTASAPSGFPITITLQSPIGVAGVTYSEITFRIPRGRDWRRWGAKPEGQERLIGLMADLTGVDAIVFDELELADHRRCVEIAENFFGGYQMNANAMIKQLLTSPSAAGLLTEIWKSET